MVSYVDFEKIFKWPLEIPFSWSRTFVILASFPKSGNTWFRFVVANIVSGRLSGERIDFGTLEKYAPVIKKDRFVRKCLLESNTPTFLKTHFHNTPLFGFYDAVVIYRNPEDVFRSFFLYVKSEHGVSFEDLSSLINDSRLGIDNWKGFHQSWLSRPNCIFVSYDDLIKRPFEGFNTIFDLLGYSVTEQELSAAIAKSSKEEMSRLERFFGDPNKKDPDYRFVGESKNRSYSGEDLPFVRNKLERELSDLFLALEKRKVMF